MLKLRFGRRQGVGPEVRDMSAGGWQEANLLSAKERRERSHSGDEMIARERWDLLG